VEAFWLALLARAAVSAGVVVTATVAAEAAGPFWGGLIVSLPIGAGPAYAMLALQHDDAFIAASALGSFAANAATFVFLAALALLRPWVDATYGLNLDIDAPTQREWLMLGTIVVAGFLAGLLPAMRAYRLSLADGMTVRT